VRKSGEPMFRAVAECGARGSRERVRSRVGGIRSSSAPARRRCYGKGRGWDSADGGKGSRESAETAVGPGRCVLSAAAVRAEEAAPGTAWGLIPHRQNSVSERDWAADAASETV